MKKDEIELDKLVKDFEEDAFKGVPPIFELAVTTISLLLTITFFVYPEMLFKDYAAYGIMVFVMPSWMWAFAFFGSSMLKGIGLLIDVKPLRVFGLIGSSILYFILSISFASDFPAISSITYGVLSLFSIVSIYQVKTTSIINRKEDN